MAPNNMMSNTTLITYDIINNMLSLPGMFKMEANRENQRFYIFTRLKLGDNLKKIYDDLKYVYSDQALPYNTCVRLVREFKEGRMHFVNKPHPGTPKSKVNEVLIANVLKQIEVDSNFSIHETSSELDISLGTIRYVLHEELGLCKISARWVQHVVTPEQKISRVDYAKMLPPAKIFITKLSYHCMLR